MGWSRDWAPYVPVAKRKASAARAMAARVKKGFAVTPVSDVPRKIATTVWGKAWIDGLESHASIANRLERGRTYVRNGSVVHLEIKEGAVAAIVSGSELYDVSVSIRPLESARWKAIVARCSGRVRSAIDLLRGKLSPEVLATLTESGKGMLPLPGELRMKCSCPDGASLCKHVAATLYGVGARLDHAPELLFVLRGVSERDLVADASAVIATPTSARALSNADEALGDIFGIDLSGELPAERAAPAKPVRLAKPTPTKAAPAKAAPKKPAPRKTAPTEAAPKKPAPRKTAPKKPARTGEDAVSGLRSRIAAIIARTR